MKSLLSLVNLKPSKQPKQPALFLYEHDNPSHRSYRRDRGINYSSYRQQTTLFVVFDGETQRRFSSVKIMLYCDMSMKSSQLSRTCVGVSVLEILTYHHTTGICTGHYKAPRGHSMVGTHHP